MGEKNIAENNYKLTDDQIKSIAKNQFDKLSENITEKGKKFIVVGGQSGSGKSKLVEKKFKKNGKQAVIINLDKLRRTHPSYEEIYEKYGQDIYWILGEYTSKLVDEILQLSRKESYSVIFEVAMRNDKGLIKYLNLFRKSGYDNEINIIARSKFQSDATIFKRYCRQRKQGKLARFVNPAENSITKLIETSMKIYEEPELYNKIQVYIRSFKDSKKFAKIYSSSVNEDVTPEEAINVGIAVSELKDTLFLKQNYKKCYLDLLKNNDVEIYKKLKILAKDYFKQVKEKESRKNKNEEELDR